MSSPTMENNTKSQTANAGESLEDERHHFRDNFPLPRELRDHMYSYLLDADAVRYTPEYGQAKHSSAYNTYGSTAHTYKFHTDKFHTAILRINKAIHAETKEFLYKNNQFVFLSFKMPGFHISFQRLDVPVVTTFGKTLAGFKHHVLGMSLQWEHPPYSSISKQLGWNAPKLEQGGILMMLQDWPKFCSALAFQCNFVTPKAVFVTSRPGIELRLDTVDRANCPVLKVVCRKTLYHGIDLGMQGRILNSLGAVSGCGSSLFLGGFRCQDDVAKCIADTSPPLVWMRALDWDRLDALLAVKRAADDLAQQGLLDAADYRYTSVFLYARDALANSFGNPTPHTDPDRVTFARRLTALLSDSLCNRLACNLRREYDSNREAAMEELRCAPLTLSDLPLESLIRSRHLEMLLLFVHAKADGAYGIYVDLDAVFDLLVTSSGCESLLHDYMVVSEARDKFGDAWLANLSIDDLSIRALPLRLVDSQSELQLPGRRPGLVKWQDEVHLRQHSPEDKQRIQALQKQHGMQISKFD